MITLLFWREGLFFPFSFCFYFFVCSMQIGIPYISLASVICGNTVLFSPSLSQCPCWYVRFPKMFKSVSVNPVYSLVTVVLFDLFLCLTKFFFYSFIFNPFNSVSMFFSFSSSYILYIFTLINCFLI